MKTYPKACVILGAGASHDVHGEGSLLIEKSYKPPLSIDLFDISKNPAYYEILRQYPGAELLAQSLATLVKSGQASVEDALRHYAEHPNDIIRNNFKQIPGYLRDLLFRASYQYTNVPSSYIELITELLAENPHQLLFIVLNYDTLLESALSRFEVKYNFNNIAGYIEDNNLAKVIKLHGSINWLKILGEAHASGNTRPFWYNQVNKYDIFSPVKEQDIIVANVTMVCDYTNPGKNRYLYYPIITAPLAGKDISKTVCPESHIDITREFLRDCKKFLIIGCSGLDEDLLALINSVLVDVLKGYIVHFVGYQDGVNESLVRFKRGVRAFAKHTTMIKVWKTGFRHYLQSGLKSFANQENEW